PAPKSPSTTKSLTVTDGQNQARIELKKEGGPPAKGSATPGDAPEDDEATPPDKGSGRGIIIDKRGHVQIQGFGDKEFDSVGDFVQNEPELAGMVVAIVTVVFLAPVLV